jgi:hypothetical protein
VRLREYLERDPLRELRERADQERRRRAGAGILARLRALVRRLGG